MRQIFLAVRAADADLEAAGLRVAQVGAAAHFEVFFLAGRPRLHVAGLDLEVGQIARAALKRSHRDVEAPKELDGVAPQLVVPRHGILGLADDDHLLLLELMDAVDAALLDAVGALLLAEAGAVAGQCLRQRLFGNDLVDEFADHRVLRCADQVQVLALDLVHHGVHLGKGHDARHHRAADHERRDVVVEALSDHEVSGIGKYCRVKSRDIAHQVIEAVAGDAPGAVQIDAVKSLHDLCVIRDLIGRNHRIAVFCQLYVAGIVGTDRYGGIDDIGDEHHILEDDLVGFLFDGIQLGQPVRHPVYLRLDRIDLRLLGGVLFGLPHQRADLLGELLALRAELVGLLLCFAALLVVLYYLIHHRKLCVLKLLADIFLYDLRILSQKLNVDHVFPPVYCIFRFLYCFRALCCAARIVQGPCLLRRGACCIITWIYASRDSISIIRSRSS